MPKLRTILLPLLVLALAGAGTYAWRYAHRVQPEPPPRGASTRVAPNLASESSLHVPIAIDVDLIARTANDKLPAKLLERAGIAAGNGATVDVVVRRSGAITAEARAGKIHLRVPVEADIVAHWQPEGLASLLARGKQRPIETRAAFVIDAEISLGVDPEWNLSTATQATLRWDNDPVVQLGPASIKLSTLAGDRIEQQFAAAVQTIDQQLRARVPMRAMVTNAWAAAFRPLAIGGRGDLWLVMQPRGMSLGEVEARDGQVFLDAGVQCVVRVVLGKQPPPVEPTVLPPRSAHGTERGVQLDVPVVVSFEAANRQLDERVEGKVLDVEVMGGIVPLTIATIEVYPSGEHIAVAADFSADLPGQWLDVRGRVYLVGTPVLDVQRRQLSIADLAYDARTNAALVDFADWMLHERIVRRVQDMLVFGFEERLDQYQEQVNAAIAEYKVTDTVRLRGKLAQTRVVALTVTDPAITAVVQLRGEARLELASAP